MLVALWAFAFQIYGDFAGYSNIARGVSKLMGIELNVNFLFPYFVDLAAGVLAATGTSACPRGCATTSTFRSAAIAHGAWKTHRNLMITMVLGGLWHGAAWTFVHLGHLPGADAGGGRVIAAGRRGPASSIRDGLNVPRDSRWAC